MIPKLKPFYDEKEWLALLPKTNQIHNFEIEAAKTLNTKYALAFPYGRSGIYTFLKAMNIEKAEIMMPAYTCVVIPNAVVMANNTPTFTDISLKDYNMDLTKLKLTNKTKAIIPTSLFGNPVNLDQLKRTKDVYTIQDSALGYLSTYKGKSVANQGDIALYSLGIGKQLSTLQGGLVTTNNEEIYQKMKNYRNQNFKKAPLASIKKHIFFLAQAIALNNSMYSLTYWLWKKKLITAFTNYFKEDTIELPNNFNHLITNLQAKLGLQQLKKLPEIIQKRKTIANFYHSKLHNLNNLTDAPNIEGSSYSHYVPRIKNRDQFIETMAKKGIHVGHHFEYTIPDLKPYQKYKKTSYPNAERLAKEAVNIPNYPHLTVKQQERILKAVKESI